MGESWCPLPEKNSEDAPDIKDFQRVNLCPFPGLNVKRSGLQSPPRAMFLVQRTPNETFQ